MRESSNHVSMNEQPLQPSACSANEKSLISYSPEAIRFDALHGLRGLACIIVFNQHLIGNFTANSLFGYGSEGIYVYSQLPFVRLWFMGQSAIAILFVISGYGLSYSPLAQAYIERDTHGALRRLISAFVRRPFRLYLPVFADLLIVGLCSYLGLFEAARIAYGIDNEIYFFADEPPPRFADIVSQLRDVANAGLDLLSVDKYAENNPPSRTHYNNNLWTMPLEAQTSLLLLLVLIVASQLRPFLGQASLMILIIQGWLYTRWEIVCIFGGSTLALKDILHRVKDKEAQLKERRVASHPVCLTVPQEIALVLVASFLLSAPGRDCSADPFYSKLNQYLIHSGYDESIYLRAVGALLMVWTAPRSTLLLGILKNRHLQYLGDISFSLYLVHGPIIRCIIGIAVPWMYVVTGNGTYDGQTQWATVVVSVISVCICLPPTLVIAGWWNRFIEIPLTRLTRRLPLT